MTQSSIQHVHLTCQNLQDMIDFWTQSLGATLIQLRKFGAHDGATLDCNGGSKLYLKCVPCSPQPSPLPHAGFEHIGVLVANLDATLGHIATLPNGKVVREPFMSGGMRCAFVTGPENILIELMENPV